MGWVSLNTHSQYSLLHSTASIKSLVNRAKELNMSALALTDTSSLYGAIDFYQYAKSVGIQPLIGCELFVAPECRFDKKKIHGQSHGYPLVFLVKNEQGYRNLCKLSSKAHLEGFYYTPRIDLALLKEYHEGLMCFVGSTRSRIGQYVLHEEHDSVEKEIQEMTSIFGSDLYFSVQRHVMDEEGLKKSGFEQESWLLHEYETLIKNQELAIKAVEKLSKKHSIECVVTNDVHYIEREDWLPHEILLNIGLGEVREDVQRSLQGFEQGRVLNPKRKVFYSHEYYFKSSQKMAALFSDHPEWVERTEEIANQCVFSWDFTKQHYPVFVPPKLEGKKISEEKRKQSCAAFLKDLCKEGIGKRYTEEVLQVIKQKFPDQAPLDVVKKRVDYELDIILTKGLGDYLLIVYDFVNWAKNHDIPMGPGRGSGVGSIVLFLIGITDIEPLQFDLFFERFINPQRPSYPDIDVDICMERREEVINYTIEKHGKEHVAQIITFGSMKAKMAIKDVGRVLNVPLVKINALAKLVPEDLNITIEKALEDADFKAMVEGDAEIQKVIKIAQKLEGSIRNTGTHAAGLIICANPLVEHMPVCLGKDSKMWVTQYAMKPVESIGMLKIDFLGLKTLTSIQKACQFIKKNKNIAINWSNLPLDDQKTKDLLNKGMTAGIFQLESTGMREMIKQLKIDQFEDLMAAAALYRPGPMEMIPSFIQRKHGQEKITYDHPDMEPILYNTRGIIVYQEQVMQLAGALAGYTLGEGDILRRAMGKKDKDQMAQERDTFIKGAEKKGISSQLAESIFTKIEKFASYGFNRSHATAYAYLSYVTAYLKANYPCEWMSALMTCDVDDTSKVAKHMKDCVDLNILVLPPNINESLHGFVATSGGIRFGLHAIKGVGEGVVQAIIDEREEEGLFDSFVQFISRIDTKKVPKKAIENLIAVGSFNTVEQEERHVLRAHLDTQFETASRKQKDKEKGYMELFETEHTPTPVISIEPNRLEEIKKEKELLGFYLTSHPLEEVLPQLAKWGCQPLDPVTNTPKGVALVAFVIDDIVVRISQRTQKKFAFIHVSDKNTFLEIPLWADVYQSVSPFLVENEVYCAVLVWNNENKDFKLQCKTVIPLRDMSESKKKETQATIEASEKMANRSKKIETKKTQKVFINVDLDLAKMSEIVFLKKTLQSHPGTDVLNVQFMRENRLITEIEVDPLEGVEVSEAFKKSVLSIPMVQEVNVE